VHESRHSKIPGSIIRRLPGINFLITQLKVPKLQKYWCDLQILQILGEVSKNTRTSEDS
jgi:hypothetical protein